MRLSQLGAELERIIGEHCALERITGEHCAAAEGLLRAGGVLVFATCSLQRAEGERQADYLATLPQLEPLHQSGCQVMAVSQ